MLASLRKIFASKKPKPVNKPSRHRGQVQTGPQRLVPVVSLYNRKVRQALLGLEGLDPASRNVIWNMAHMTDQEIHGPHQAWSDPY